MRTSLRGAPFVYVDRVCRVLLSHILPTPCHISRLTSRRASIFFFCNTSNAYQFDAGIILRELGRCGLHDLVSLWDRFAREGFCTMNIPFCRWATLRADQGDQASAKGKLILGLPILARAFRVPNCATLLAQHHDAGVDADLTATVYAIALRDAAAAVAVQIHSR